MTVKSWEDMDPEERADVLSAMPADLDGVPEYTDEDAARDDESESKMREVIAQVDDPKAGSYFTEAVEKKARRQPARSPRLRERRDEPEPEVDLDPRAGLVRADKVRVGDIPWLWKGYIPKRGVTYVVGPGAARKSQFGLWLASAVAGSVNWPDGTPAPDGRVRIWTREDLLDAIVVPRLIANGADLSKVDLWNIRGLTIVGAVERERRLMVEERAELIIFDSWNRFTSSGDGDRVSIGEELDAAEGLATEFDCAVVILDNTRKFHKSGAAEDAQRGSAAKRDFVRSVIQLERDERDGTIVAARTKANWASDWNPREDRAIRFHSVPVQVDGVVETQPMLEMVEVFQGWGPAVIEATQQSSPETPGSSSPKPSPERSQFWREVINAVAAGHGEFGAIVEAVMASGVKKPTGAPPSRDDIRNALGNLKRAGDLKKVDEGWVLSG